MYLAVSVAVAARSAAAGADTSGTAVHARIADCDYWSPDTFIAPADSLFPVALWAGEQWHGARITAMRPRPRRERQSDRPIE